MNHLRRTSHFYERVGQRLIMVLCLTGLPGLVVAEQEVALLPVTQVYACTDEIKSKVKLTESTITFTSTGKVISYRNEKFKKWKETKSERAKSTPFDMPFCLPGGKKLALMHVQQFYEYSETSASFYNLEGEKIGYIKTLYEYYPDFSPNGEYVVVNSSDPYSDPMVDGSIIIFNLKGEEIFNTGRFPEFFAKTFSMDMSSAYPLFPYSSSSSRQVINFSKDSKYVAIPIIVSRQLGRVPVYENASEVYIFIISMQGKLVKAIKEPVSNDKDLLHKLHSLLESK